MQTNYQEEIRKLLNDEGLINKELSSGCKVLAFLYRNWDIVDDRSVDRFTLSCEDIVSDGRFITHCQEEYIIYENLYHPWDLREVMAWFDKQDVNMGVTNNGDFVYINEDNEWVYKKVWVLNIIKPLSEQDLKPLYELMISIRDNK